MAETRISSTEFVRTIGEVLGRVRYRGEAFIIERNGEAVGLLSPYPGEQKADLRQTLRAWLQAAPPDPELADLLDGVGKDDKLPEKPWE